VDLDALETIVRVNGTETTRFRTNAMLFGVAVFISAMSRYLTLHPGDVIWPEGGRCRRCRDHRDRHAAQSLRRRKLGRRPQAAVRPVLVRNGQLREQLSARGP
jgi:hypothetical protein